MDKNTVAVLGGGNGAHALAADLTNRGYKAVSYTHLDVYKRQMFCRACLRT